MTRGSETDVGGGREEDCDMQGNRGHRCKEGIVKLKKRRGL